MKQFLELLFNPNFILVLLFIPPALIVFRIIQTLIRKKIGSKKNYIIPAILFVVIGYLFIWITGGYSLYYGLFMAVLLIIAGLLGV